MEILALRERTASSGQVLFVDARWQNNGRLTVLQAVALASGVNKTAALGRAKIIHKALSGYREADIHLTQLLQGKAPDMELVPEDILFVPNSKLKSVVAGGVTSAVQTATTAVIYRIKYRMKP